MTLAGSVVAEGAVARADSPNPVHLGSSKAANRSFHSYMRGGGPASAGQGQRGIWPTELPEMTQAMG
jgi:hypothetical protein